MYQLWQIHGHKVFKGLRYFRVVENGNQIKAFLVIRYKRKWHCLDAKDVLRGDKALFIRPTLTEIRKDILEYMNKP